MSNNNNNINNINNNNNNLDDNYDNVNNNSNITQMFRLNKEGIEQYKIIKKKQYLDTFKWSLFGTALGYSLSIIVEILMKRSEIYKKDYTKTAVFILCTASFYYIGYRVSFYEFNSKQRELCNKYGTNIKEEYF